MPLTSFYSPWKHGQIKTNQSNGNANQLQICFLYAGPHCLNLFLTNISLLYPLKISENLQFSDVFKGYRSGTLFGYGLKWVKTLIPHISSIISYWVELETFIGKYFLTLERSLFVETLGKNFAKVRWKISNLNLWWSKNDQK